MRLPRLAWRDGVEAGERAVAEECAVALTYDGSTHAVMMATPADLEDFAVGFSLSEGIVAAPDAIRELEIVRHPDGMEGRMWLAADAGQALARRRRAIVGPAGCGLCGVESLEEAAAPPPAVTDEIRFTPDDIAAALHAFAAALPLGATTRAVHAAGLWRADAGLVMVREDVGRHNALDKLAGGLARAGRDARGGMVLLTSRVSVEMVQKAARMGAPLLAAVSAPTTLAVATAQRAGLTLVAVARDDGFELFTHPRRIVPAAGAAAR